MKARLHVKLIIAALLLWCGLGVGRAADLSLDLSGLATSSSVTSNGFKVSVYGDYTYAGGALTLKPGGTVTVVATDKPFTKMVLGDYAESGISISSDTRNGKFAKEGSSYSWTANGDAQTAVTFVASYNAGTAGQVSFRTLDITTDPAGTLAEVPTMTLTPNTLTAVINQYKFAPPVISIKDKRGNDITNRFVINYFVQGITNYGKDADGRDITTSLRTGTSVTRLYGKVKIGDRAGQTGIVVAAAPIDRYAKQYSMVNSLYTITVNPQTPVLSVSPKPQMAMAVGQTVPAPTITASYTDDQGRVQPIPQDHYTLSAQVVSGGEHISFANQTIAASGNTIKGLTAGDVTLRYTLTPKDSHKDTYATQTVDVTIKVNENTGKIKTHVEFAETDQYIYKFDNKSGYGIVPQKGKIIDEYGNDVTAQMNADQVNLQFATPVTSNEQGYTSGDQAYQQKDYGKLDIYNVNSGQHNAVSDVTYTITATAPYPGWLTGGVKDIYESPAAGSYTLHVLPRPLTPDLTPNPEETKVTKGYAIHFVAGLERAFVVDGKFTNQFTGEKTVLHFGDGGGYTYAVGIPDAALASGAITIVGEKSRLQPTSSPTSQLPKGYTFYDIKEKYGNENMHITFNEAREFDLKFIIYNWTPQQWDLAVRNTTFHVVNTIPATMLIDPNLYNLYTNEPVGSFVEPTVKITNGFGDDITEHYNLTYEVASDGTGTTVTSDGVVTLGNRVGQTIIKVNGTPKDPNGLYEPTSGTYTINLKDPTGRFTYDILKKDSPEDKDMGKMVITGAGDIVGSYEIDGVPGMRLRFGASADNDWHAATENGRLVTESTPIRFLADNGMVDPAKTTGTYFELIPITNGFLTIDANFKQGHTVVLIGKDAAGKVLKETYRVTAALNGEYAFKAPLLAGLTYYLYDEGAAGDNQGLGLHGLNYQPAYIITRADDEPVERATLFMNGYTGGLPRLVAAPDAKTTFDSSDKTVATVDPKSGRVTPVKTSQNSTTISARVESYEKEGVYRTPKYVLYVSDIPVYVVSNEENFSVNERLTTTNHDTDIEMTMGGWKDGSGPYNRLDEDGNVKESDVVDGWNTAKEDLVSHSLDNFTWQTQGKINPTDEYSKPYTEAGTTQKPGNLPARGGYLRFEPRESGTLMVYVLQNGACDYDERTDNSGHQLKNRELKWRPLFITDETGKAIKMDNSWTVDGLSQAAANPNSATKGAYTENHYRASYSDSLIVANKSVALDGQLPDADGWDWSKFKGDEQDKQLLKDHWIGKTSKDVMKVIPLSNGGFTLVSKAYVRYSFHVKAGKTYFVFQKGSKLGFAGFAFMPEGWTPDRGDSRVKGDDIVLSDKENYVAPAGEPENVKVTLKRKFVKGHWTSITLPFSVQETQFKEIFGENTVIATFDKIQSGGTDGGILRLRQHVYHMIGAGVPYFIKPDKNLDEVVFPNASFENSVDPTFFYSDPQGGFMCKGIYNPTTIAPYSYILNGVLTRRVEESKRKLGGYRAYLENQWGKDGNLVQAAGAKLVFMDGDMDMETTGIDDIVLDGDEMQSSANGEGVYDLQGRKVAASASELGKLSKGIYIVNGNKITVR